MRRSQLLPLTLWLWIGLSPAVSAFEAKRVYAGQKNYGVDFSESDAKEILAHAGITNWYAYDIERDSSGTALFVSCRTLGTPSGEHTLVINEAGWKLIDLPHATGSSGFFDSLEKAYSFENDYYVFQNGQRLPWKGKAERSRLYLYCSPGNEVLALRYSNDADYIVARAIDPLTALFHISDRDIQLRKLFHKNGTVLVCGLVPDGKEHTHWECWTFRKDAIKWELQSRIAIPDAVEVLDLDPESPNILCYRWGIIHKKAFLFNLETKQTSKTSLRVWRDHGYFLRDGTVRAIRAALDGREVPKSVSEK